MEAVMLLTLSWARSLLIYVAMSQIAAQKIYFLKHKIKVVR